MSGVIETRRLVKRFGRRAALAGLDLQVPPGAVYVLVGPNGAGKTTTLRVLLDLARATSGSARVAGHDTVRDGARVRALCGHVPERQDAGYGWMTVQQVLSFHKAYRSGWDDGYARQLMERLDVRDHTKFGKLSKGEARRVQLVMALAHRPPILLLDEPTDGLDPVMREEALALLSDHIADHDATMVISTHLVYEVEGLGDHLGVLKDGVLTAQLHRDTLRAQLRRYKLEVPDQWVGASDLNGSVVRRDGRGRERAWTVWGGEREVVERLTGAGAKVRHVEPLKLEEAAVALLSMRENQDRLTPELMRVATTAEGRS